MLRHAKEVHLTVLNEYNSIHIYKINKIVETLFVTENIASHQNDCKKKCTHKTIVVL